MIVSASRRTDIPAFYSKWLLERLRQGFVMVRNPHNSQQISRISLAPDVVDCLVFWTKNGAPLFAALPEISQGGYAYYFLWTITPYGKIVEPGLPDKRTIVRSFCYLSARIGPKRMIWRYDPVILGGPFTIDYHVEAFKTLCRELSGFTEKCIFSYLDIYRKIVKRLQAAGINPDKGLRQKLTEETVLAEALFTIAAQYQISLTACVESLADLSVPIAPASCIDSSLIEQLIGAPLAVPREQKQRSGCFCHDSIDIGAYDSCLHGCIYCYGTSSEEKVRINCKQHKILSPLLIGQVEAADLVHEKLAKSLKIQQGSLF